MSESTPESEKKEQKVAFVMGDKDVPLDHFFIDDPVVGKRFFMRREDAYQEVTSKPKTPIRRHADRQYEMTDTDSFIRAIAKYGDPKEGVIFYADNGLQMFFNESNREEGIILHLKPSLELKTFFEGNGQRTQKELLRLFETFPECLGDQAKTLIPSIECLKLNATIEFESDLNPNNLVFSYKDKNGTQSGKIPKRIEIILPYFEGSKNEVTIIADLEVKRPSNENEKPVFTLTDPKAHRTERNALELEVEGIQDELESWHFFHGAAYPRSSY